MGWKLRCAGSRFERLMGKNSQARNASTMEAQSSLELGGGRAMELGEKHEGGAGYLMTLTNCGNRHGMAGQGRAVSHLKLSAKTKKKKIQHFPSPARQPGAT